MKRVIALVLGFFLFSGAPASAEEEIILPEFPKTKIMVLGTYHMANPGLDTINIEADNVLSDRRQAELAELVAALAEFQPTIIAVESPYDSDRTATEYGAYLAGEYELEANETDQTGYRLGKMLGLETVYPVDFPMGMGDGLEIDWEHYGQAFAETNAALDGHGSAAQKALNDNLASMTVGQYLRWMNSPEMTGANHFFYSAYLMKNGKDGWFPGPEMVANWYKRNLMILHNLMRLAEPPGEQRVLVIFGQGHAYLLKQFLEESPYFEVVNVLDYLPD